MAQNYTRQSSFADGDTITAALFNNEFNQVVNAFAYSASSDSSTGHKHDGTSGQGGNIPQIGDIDFLNKIVVDNTNNRWGFYVQVSGGTVEQLRIQDGAIVPVTNNDIDLGTSSLEFKDLFLDGTAHIDTLDVDVNATVAGTLGVTGATTLSSTLGVTGAITGSSTLQATTITATTAFVPDASDGASLGTVSLEFSDLFLADGALIAFGDDQDVTLTHLADAGLLLNGARGLFFNDTTQYINAPNGTTLDIAATDEIELNATLIDINGAVDISGNLDVGGNLVVTGTTTFNGGTLTMGDAATDNVVFGADINSNIIPNTDDTYDLGSSSQEWRNLYIDGTANIDSLVADTADINGGTIDGVTIGGSSAGDITYANLSDGTITITAFADEDDMSSDSATLVPTQQSVKAYVDAQVTAQDLDIVGDTGTDAIDLDSETITFAGGTGITSVVTTGTVTHNIDSTVATLTGSQTLTNKSLTAPTLTGTAIVASLDISGDIDVDGTTNLDVVDIDGAVDFASTTAHAGNATFADNAKAIFGAGSDLQIFHNGTESFIREVGEGGLKIDTNGPDLTLRVNATETALVATSNGAVQLYYDNAEKLATTATGIDVTGTATMGGLTVAGNNLLVSFQDTNAGGGGGLQFKQSTGAEVGRIAFNDGADLRFFTGASVTERLHIDGATGDIRFYEDTGTTPKLTWDASAESLNFGDNTKAIFGAGSDLQIYHDGSDSYITDAGTGDLRIRGANVEIQTGGGNKYFQGAANVASLYHTNNLKLATTATGIDVTGSVTADGLTVDDVVSIDTSSGNAFSSTGNLKIDIDSDDSQTDRTFQITSDGSSKTLFEAKEGGDISFYEDTGTTPKLTWDASAESLGIGVTPNTRLHVSSATTTKSVVETTGTTSDALIEFTKGQGSAETWSMGIDNSNQKAFSLAYLSNGSPSLTTHGLLTVDTSGNLLVGTTSVGIGDAGIELRADGQITGTRDGNYAALLNRIGSGGTENGDIINLRANGTTVGSIGSNSGTRTYFVLDPRTAYKGAGITGSSIDANTSNIIPTDKDGTIANGDINLGYASSRWKNLYLSGTLTNNGTGGISVDTSGNVGIGTSAPADLYTGARNLVVGGGTAESGMTIYSNSTTGNLYFADGTAGSEPYVGYIEYNHASNFLRVGTDGAEAMRIDASGKVGIGTDSPAEMLEIYNATSPAIQLNDGGDYQAIMRLAGNDLEIRGSSGSLEFYTGAADGDSSTERMRIDASGNLLVRQTSAVVRDTNAGADVQAFWGNQFSSSSATTSKVMIGSGSSQGYVGMSRVNTDSKYITNAYIRFDNSVYTAGSEAGFMSFYTQSGGTNAAERMRIDSGGRVGIGKTPDTNFGGYVLQLNGGSQTFMSFGNSTTGTTLSDGFIIGCDANGADLYQREAQPLRFHTSNTERMRLDASGNFIVGGITAQASDAVTLLPDGEVTAAGFYFSNNIGAAMNDTGIRKATTSTMVFDTASTERMRIDANGAFYVGTTTTGSNVANGFTIQNPTGATYTALGHANGTASGLAYAVFSYNSGTIGSITQSGTTAVLYNTTSDQRLKENIADADDAGSKIDAIQVRKFDWKADGSHQDYGMVAQELLEVAPSAVSAPEDSEEMMGVDYSKLVPMMLKEIQSLRARVAQLES